MFDLKQTNVRLSHIDYLLTLLNKNCCEKNLLIDKMRYWTKTTV